MPAGRYLRTAVLGWIQGDAMPTAPTSVWLHLCTGAPTATTPGTEPTKVGYAPIEIEPADWAAIVEGANSDYISTSAGLTFGPFTSGADETATHAMLMDGSDPGTAEILDYAALASSRLMTNGGTVVIAAGDMRVLA